MASKQKILASGLLAALLLSAHIAARAEADGVVKDALAMVNSGQARQAYDALEPLETARAGDPDFDTVFGIAANDTGNYTRAIFALERALAVQPGNARARAELGRAMFAVGDTKGARTLLQQTRDQGVPVEAAGTIDQFLQAIDRVEEGGKSSWKGFVEAGIGDDTNINSGPGNSIVAVPLFGGLPLTLNPAGVKTGAGFATLAAGVSGRYVIDPRWSLIGNATTNWRGHSGSNDQFNTAQTDLNAGASYRVERNDYSLVAQYSTYAVDGSRARDSAGVVGEWTYRFDGYRQVTSYLQYAKLTYPQQGVRDADRTVIGSTYAHLFPQGVLVFGGFYFGTEKESAANVPHLGHDLVGLRLGVQKPLSQTLSLFATLGYEGREFGGRDPLFLVTRKDDQTNLNLGLSWSPAALWRITPQIAWTRSSSNVAINDYSKRVVSVVARREF
ncbi:MAG: DUF560 domain-containing protein [Comamonadaceae bacterium]|nr:MAG: DUF560 domain-containing protein [Comamonadaceae bacterium]